MFVFTFKIFHFRLGFATFNPVAASPLIGFGDPPSEINFSILDYHGLNDQTIPYSEETSFGKGPHESVVSSDGYYYVNKVPYLQGKSFFFILAVNILK